MPIGITRLNARHQQPNSRITFVKPLPGSTNQYAQDFLERIAAICHPIMKAHHLSITTLEEYEPNPEFVGRNFNAGEIIQLVLRARNGQWLGFKSVQMVMMHELAHCLEMNHRKKFWEVRNTYARELRELWGKGYTGDGFWGKGKTVLSEEYENERPVPTEAMPSGLCGGTFRSRRKRRRKDKVDSLSYQERKERRIARKFGVNGVALGGDEEARVKLEYGQKKVKAKPRVAGSARGRELRAAAALARFGQQKEEEATKDEMNKEEAEEGSGSESEDGDTADEGKEAVNFDGSRILDGKGQSMARVCEDDDGDDSYVKQEMQELQNLEHVESDAGPTLTRQSVSSDSESVNHGQIGDHIPESTIAMTQPVSYQANLSQGSPLAEDSSDASPATPIIRPSPNQPVDGIINCNVCSMANESSAATCLACSHVLNTAKVPGHWRCKSDNCANSQYINVSDNILCSVCGKRRQEL